MSDSDKPLGLAPNEGLGPRPRVMACPFAVFDEHGKGADDRVQDYAAQAVAAEREWCADRLRDTAAHMRNNAKRLRQYGGMEPEARARELAASYVDEFAQLLDFDGPNVELSGHQRPARKDEK